MAGEGAAALPPWPWQVGPWGELRLFPPSTKHRGVREYARRLAGLDAETLEQALREILLKEGRILVAIGVDAETARQHLSQYERAIRAELWRMVIEGDAE